jgi:hypothetical protein
VLVAGNTFLLVFHKPKLLHIGFLLRVYPTRRSKGQVSEFETPVNSLIRAKTPSNSYRLVVSNSTTKSHTPQVRCSADTSGMRCKDFCTELAVLPRTSIIITARTSSSVSSVFKSMVKRLMVRLSIKRVSRLCTVPRASRRTPAKVVTEARPSIWSRAMILRSISSNLDIL